MSQSVATRHDLTDLQARFVHYMSDGAEPARAAELAGYKVDTGSTVAYDLLHTAHVLAAIQSEVRRKLVSLAPMALGVIQRMVKDETTPPKLRLDGARTLLDRAGHIAPRAIADKTSADISLHEMTIGELRDLAGKLEGELSTRAKPVNSATAAPLNSQPIDLA